MSREELEFLLTTNSLRPTPDEAAIVFALLVTAVIFTLLGIFVGWSLCLAMQSIKSGGNK